MNLKCSAASPGLSSETKCNPADLSSSCGVISRVVTNAAGRADRDLRKIPSRIVRKSITFNNDTAFAQHALPRTMRAMTNLVLRCLCLMAKARGRERQPSITTLVASFQIDIDQVSDEEIQDIVITGPRTSPTVLGKRVLSRCITQARLYFSGKNLVANEQGLRRRVRAVARRSGSSVCAVNAFFAP
jgi:hypothetical protein